MRAGHVWFNVERLLNAAWVLSPDTGQYKEVLTADLDRMTPSDMGQAGLLGIAWGHPQAQEDRGGP